MSSTGHSHLDSDEGGRLAAYRDSISVGARVRDEELFAVPRLPDEHEIQARWFAGDCGQEFQTVDGEMVRVVQFGIWNRESGPDFIEAAVEIAGRRSRGAIEIDREDRDWERHGHATNPAYEDVVLHVILGRSHARFFTRTVAGRHIPQVHLASPPCEAGGAAADPPVARPGRCVAALGALGPGRGKTLIETAAVHRLKRKGQRLARLAVAHGPDEALFMALAEAMGYRENKIPFLLLAGRLTLKYLRRQHAEAVLLGVSGFLEKSSRGGASESPYLRSLWEAWWPLRGTLDRFVLPATAWKLSGVRPANHPQRRLAALALVVRHWGQFRRAAEGGDPAGVFMFFNSLTHEYWDVHATLTSRAFPRSAALVGKDRAREIVLNVVAPAMIEQDAKVLACLRSISAGPPSRKVEIAKRRLFGNNAGSSGLIESALEEQGVIQIFEDFCLHDSTDCASCPFPELSANWR